MLKLDNKVVVTSLPILRVEMYKISEIQKYCTFLVLFDIDTVSPILERENRTSFMLDVVKGTR